MKLIKDAKRVEIAEEIRRNLYTIIMKVIAFSYDDLESHNREYGLQLLETMSDNVAKLHDKYLEKMLAGIENIDAENTDASECIQLLSGIISVCGFQVSLHFAAQWSKLHANFQSGKFIIHLSVLPDATRVVLERFSITSLYIFFSSTLTSQ
jgi:hypothetical protein